MTFVRVATLFSAILFFSTAWAQEGPPPSTCEVDADVCTAPRYEYYVEDVTCPNSIGVACGLDLPPATIDCDESVVGVVTCEATPQVVSLSLNYEWAARGDVSIQSSQDSPIVVLHCLREHDLLVTLRVIDGFGRETEAAKMVSCRTHPEHGPSPGSNPTS